MTNIKFNGLAASHPDKTYNLYLNDNDKVKIETLNKVSSHFRNFSLDKYISLITIKKAVKIKMNILRCLMIADGNICKI